MIHDGNSETAFFNITDTFGGSAGFNASVVINDNGDIGNRRGHPIIFLSSGNFMTRIHRAD
jgi:hypothetical protein